MENLPTEILIHIFSFHQFDVIDFPSNSSSSNSSSEDPTKALFQFLMKLTDDKALAIYKEENYNNNNIIDNNQHQEEEEVILPSSDQHKFLHKLFNYYDPISYDKEGYLLYQRYSNVQVSIRDEWFENENGRHNLDIMFTSTEYNWSNSTENYHDRLNLLHECVRDKNKFSHNYNIAFMNLQILNQTFGIGFFGQFLVKYIYHYPLEYCNLSLVSKQWKEAAESQTLWKTSTSMLQQLLRLRSDLEFIRKKLFARMSNQLEFSADENNCFLLNTLNDSALKRFQADEYCSIRYRFSTLIRYNTVLEKKLKGIAPLIDQAKTEIIQNKHAESLFDNSAKSFIEMKSIQMKENKSKRRRQIVKWCYNNFSDRVCCNPFMRKFFFIAFFGVITFLMYDMIGIVGDGLSNQMNANGTIISNQTLAMENTKFNSESFLRDLTIASAMIFSFLMMFTTLAKTGMIPVSLNQFSISITTSLVPQTLISYMLSMISIILAVEYFTYIIVSGVGLKNTLEVLLISNMFALVLLTLLFFFGLYLVFVLSKQLNPFKAFKYILHLVQETEFKEKEYSISLGMITIFLRFSAIPLLGILFWLLFSLTISKEIVSYWPLVISIWMLQVVVQIIVIFEYIWIKREKINKIYHSEVMIPVSDRRQIGEYDDNLIIKRNAEFPYESKVIQLLVILANLVLFAAGIHLLITGTVEKWLWSSPFFIIFICISYYFIRYLHFITGHNHYMLYKEYKEMLKTHNHELYDIHIENEGTFSERIVCRLKVKGEEELQSHFILEDDTPIEVEMDEQTYTDHMDQDNINLI